MLGSEVSVETGETFSTLSAHSLALSETNNLTTIVNNHPNVRLINPHSKCDCGHNTLQENKERGTILMQSEFKGKDDPSYDHNLVQIIPEVHL